MNSLSWPLWRQHGFDGRHLPGVPLASTLVAVPGAAEHGHGADAGASRPYAGSRRERLHNQCRGAPLERIRDGKAGSRVATRPELSGGMTFPDPILRKLLRW